MKQTTLTQNKYFWWVVGFFVFYFLGGWRIVNPFFSGAYGLVEPWVNPQSVEDYWVEEARRNKQRKAMNERFKTLLNTSILSRSEKVVKRLKMPFWTDEELAVEIEKLEKLQGYF